MKRIAACPQVPNRLPLTSPHFCSHTFYWEVLAKDPMIADKLQVPFRMLFAKNKDFQNCKGFAFFESHFQNSSALFANKFLRNQVGKFLNKFPIEQYLPHSIGNAVFFLHNGFSFP